MNTIKERAQNEQTFLALRKLMELQKDEIERLNADRLQLMGRVSELEGITAFDSPLQVIQDRGRKIERLNAQVAMLVETITSESHSCFIEGMITEEYALKNIGRAAYDEKYESEWLVTHDAKVRDDALEMAALRFDEHCMEVTADEIRAMKGAK